jgi:hypothetical protein
MPAAMLTHSEDASDKAFTQLFELFSKPIKSPQKAYRTYQLTFKNGEPIFTLSEASRILEEVFEEITHRVEPETSSIASERLSPSLPLWTTNSPDRPAGGGQLPSVKNVSAIDQLRSRGQ